MNESLTDLQKRMLHRHYLLGWWGLLLFLTLGIALETLHGFKSGYYLDPANRLRRLLWTLSHAHGTLLALINLAFAATLSLGNWSERRLKLASFCLLDGLLLLPLGFFLGGIAPSETDPSPLILLVPVGALFLLVGVGLIAGAGLKRK